MLDFDARYAVESYPGIAFYLRGYVMTRDADYDWTGIEDEDHSFVRAVMVGDDREHIIDVDELRALEDEGYCHVCGQIGCDHDGLERGYL